MTRSMIRSFLLVFFAVLLGISPVSRLAAETTEPPGEDAVHFFTDSVLPILEENCFSCHAGEEHSGGFQLDTRSRLIAGGDSGAVVDMQDAEASLLLEAVRYESYEMPPRGKLPAEQIAVLGKWVAAGSPYPDSMIGEVESQRPADPGAEITASDRQ